MYLKHSNTKLRQLPVSLLAHLLGACAEAAGNNAIWSGLSDTLRNLSGRCSIIASANNSFHDNSAQKAGGALFLSDLGSAHFNCTAQAQPVASAQLNNADKICPNDDWTGNTVSANQSAPGYGSILAALPASMKVSAPALDSYISDGSPTPAIAINLYDQAGTLVTTGKSPRSCCAISQAAHPCKSSCCKLHCTYGRLQCKACIPRP